MQISELIDRIPQIAPFRFVSDVIRVDETSCKVRLDLTGEEEFFGGHFPQNPIMPGCLLVESMAQSAEIIFLSKKSEEENLEKIFLVQIKDAKFYKPVVPPASLFISSSITRVIGEMCEIKTEISNREQELVAKGTIYLYCEN